MPSGLRSQEPGPWRGLFPTLCSAPGPSPLGLNAAPSACLARRGSTVRGWLLSRRHYMVDRLLGACDEGRRTGRGPGRARTSQGPPRKPAPRRVRLGLHSGGGSEIESVGLRGAETAGRTHCSHPYNPQEVTRAATDPTPQSCSQCSFLPARERSAQVRGPSAPCDLRQSFAWDLGAALSATGSVPPSAVLGCLQKLGGR